MPLAWAGDRRPGLHSLSLQSAARGSRGPVMWQLTFAGSSTRSPYALSPPAPGSAVPASPASDSSDSTHPDPSFVLRGQKGDAISGQVVSKGNHVNLAMHTSAHTPCVTARPSLTASPPEMPSLALPSPTQPHNLPKPHTRTPTPATPNQAQKRGDEIFLKQIYLPGSNSGIRAWYSAPTLIPTSAKQCQKIKK